MSELGHRLSSRELSEWMAYYELEPWGEDRGDLRAGIVASVIANVNRDPKQRRAPFEPQDFMPEFGSSEPEQPSPAELVAKFDAVLRTTGVADVHDS